MITTNQLDEWQAVCDKAMRGPWTISTLPPNCGPNFFGRLMVDSGGWSLLNTNEEPQAVFTATARSAMPQLIAEVRSLREQLRAYQTSSLRRQMRDWSEDWYGSGWESQLSQRIWLCDEWDEEDVAKPSATAIVEFGRSIDAWIADDEKVVTIAEWEAMLAEQGDESK